MNLIFLAIFIGLFGAAASITQVGSFKELAESLFNEFDVELLWRVASGRLSEKYGEEFFDFDCYIRQFVREGKIVVI